MTKSGNGFTKENIRFQCQGSGKCCVSRGSYGYVYLTKQDRKVMANSLGLATSAFTKKYCANEEGVFRLKMNEQGPECIFLDKSNKCSVYEGRPIQCRTWPFWPENMNARTWNRDVATFCPGVGKGPIRKKSEIFSQLEQQSQAEREIFDPEIYDIVDWDVTLHK